MTDLVIGCPVYKRDWIIGRWYHRVLGATARASIPATYVVVGDVARDRATFDALTDAGVRDLVIIDVNEDDHDGSRQWNPDRYAKMVWLRNKLLTAVRELNPRYFLSLDSDILIHPDALTRMLDALDANNHWYAVGSKCYMTPAGKACPSYAMLPKVGGMRRPDAEGTFTVDAIMAIKLMTRAAYKVDYVIDRQGEDIGWSKQVRAAGMQLGWDGGVCSKHVMSLGALDKIDMRCGY